MFTKYIVPAASLASYALAASCSGTTTISSAAAATSLASCDTWTGDVVIDESVAGELDISGVGQVTGDFTCDGATNLTSLVVSSLNSIGGTFTLNGLTILTNLQFDSLTSVDTISWTALPALQGLNFAAGVKTASSIIISNTELESLAGISLETVGDMDINNNPYLTEVNVNDIANATGSISFSANSADLKIDFPNLIFALNMTFRNVSSVDMPSLETVNGSLGFYSNTFETFSAANLTSTGESLVFDDNSALTNISLPDLTTVGGGFQIANNTDLKMIDGFTGLETVGGAIDFSGEFTNVSLPALKEVRGGFNLQTTETFDCSDFAEDHSEGIIKGTYVCKGKVSNPSTKGSGSSSSSSSSSSSTSSSAAPGSVAEFNFGMMAVTGVALIATVFGGALRLAL